MKGIRLFIGFLASFVFSALVMAGEVNLPHTFQPNTKAKASEVNANFNAVRDAVNDNNNRIQSLESFKSNLTGGCPAGQAMNGVNADGTPVCEDMNKGKRIVSVTYPATCFAVNTFPQDSLVLAGYAWAFLTDNPNHGANNADILFCPIALPAGAKVLRVKVRVYDNLNTGRVLAYFCHDVADPGSSSTYCHTIGSTDYSGTPGEVTMTLDFPQGEEIREGVGYSIQASLESESYQLKVGRVTIYYEYDPTYTIPDPRD